MNNFHILRLNIFCDPSTELSRRDGSNEGHNICVFEKHKNLRQSDPQNLSSPAVYLTLTILAPSKSSPIGKTMDAVPTNTNNMVAMPSP